MTTVIDKGDYFTSLPREYYLSSEIFELELTRVFTQQWLYVGHVSQVPEPGSFFTRAVGPESMIITRDDDGEVRTFFNVCRHRGARICDNGDSGSGKALVCPYHRWAFGLDGRLLGAPSLPNGVDFEHRDFPLHEARCESYFGSIFVHLSDDADSAPTVRETVADIVDEAMLAKAEPERLKLAHQHTYEIEANWKLALENNCECYHCAGAHPSLGIACDYQSFYVDRGEGARYDKKLDSLFPLRDGMKTFSMDGELVCRQPLGGGSLPDQFSAGFIIVPNLSSILYLPDHAVIHDIKPLTVDTCQMVCSWFVHEDAVEGVDYDTKSLTEVFHVTNLEDGALAERTQMGVRSRRYIPGPNSPTRESFMKSALSRYLTMMGEPAAR